LKYSEPTMVEVAPKLQTLCYYRSIISCKS
jgi:hypothetical protein